jgi:hypothetical protein
MDLPALERDLLSHAVNELIEPAPGTGRAPYSRPGEDAGA